MKKYSRIIIAFFIFSIILYLFYRSLWAFLLLPPAMLIFWRMDKKEQERKRREILGNQFKDALVSFTAALRAGYSTENSVSECLNEMKDVYGSDSPIYTELNLLANELKLGIPIEEAFENMAARSKVEDIDTFASVFKIAKRSGGNMVEIIRKTSNDISAKADTKNEISVLISAKRLEQNLMFLMPPGIILYLDISSPALLDPLYGNFKGAAIMTVCLGIYIAAYLIANKITTIEV